MRCLIPTGHTRECKKSLIVQALQIIQLQNQCYRIIIA